MINNLEQWVAGNPVHDNERNECCPDFSCCKPHLLASEEERKEFISSTPARRASMLMIFLDRMLSDELGKENTTPIIDGFAIKAGDSKTGFEISTDTVDLGPKARLK
jgi:hypothetical protein